MFRSYFPFFDQSIAPVFLDNAASTQKTRSVIDALALSDAKEHSNVHRANYALSRQNTDAFEMTRGLVAQFINAQKDEIVFTSGTTFSINLVAYSFVLPNITKDHNIVISVAEHHANLVIWQRIAALSGCELRFIELDENGDYDLLQAEELIDQNTFLLSVAHVSNVLGQLQPIKTLATLAKQFGAFVMIDGAQAVSHVDVDVAYLNADFYAFSAHKMFGPTGLGILFGRLELLNKMPPLIYGGEMVEKVTRTQTTFTAAPHRFEAGTAPISAIIAFAHAIEFFNYHTFETLQSHSLELMQYAFAKLDQIKGVEYISPKSSEGIISFNIKGIHHADIAMLLDEQNIALRTGTFCAQVLFEYLNVAGAIRIAISVYNNQADIDALVVALNKAIEMLEA